MPLFRNAFAILIMTLTAVPGFGGDSEKNHIRVLSVGDAAPVFEAVDDQGHIWKSSDIVGKHRLVIYFYPAAMTGGCTSQACAYRDHRQELQDLDAVVIGISGDRPENLKYFRQENALTFTLLADPEGKVAGAFGVPVSDGGEIVREINGHPVTLKRDVTASRWTFVIGKSGKIIYMDTGVDAAKDSDHVITFLKTLQK